MEFSLSQILVWIVVGAVGGALAGALVTRERRGFGFLANLSLGLAGAVVGGALFRIFGLFPNLETISVSMRDVVSALAGSLLVLLALWLWRRNRALIR
jgi:uncharacterized membrane protein YeaQ/YmgE (transglycosylase-associated protein family)